MINNSINIARIQLEKHKALGVNSSLSIFEVAQLMDVLTFGPSVKEPNTTNLFFNYSMN